MFRKEIINIKVKLYHADIELIIDLHKMLHHLQTGGAAVNRV